MPRPLLIPVLLALAAPAASAADVPNASPPWVPAVPRPLAQTTAPQTTVVVATPRPYPDAGAYVLLGGGLEGYTSDLKDALTVGPAAGITVGGRGRYFGLEGGLNVAGANISDNSGGDAGDGFDVMRTSGQVAATLGLLPTRLQPYVLGGGGLDFYNVRNGNARGFTDETTFMVPLGAGLRYNLGPLLTADLRGQYDLMLGDNFAPAAVDNGDRYTALLSLGGTF